MFESSRANTPHSDEVGKNFENVDVHERMERVLEKVDFELLKQIFSEQREKAGLNTETNLLPPEKIGTSGLYNTIGLTQDTSPRGIYFQQLNNIQVDPRIIQKVEKDTNSVFSFECVALKVLCHEQTHAVSTNPHEQIPLRTIMNSIQGNPVTPGGVAYWQGILGFKLFCQFNEAVTDTIAEEVYAEYLNRSGDTTFFQNKDGSNTFDTSYNSERRVLQAFVRAISRATEVPEETVWNGVKHAYYTNLDLDSNELVQLYTEVIGTDIAQIVKRPKKTKAGYEGEIQKLNAIAPYDEVPQDVEVEEEFIEELVLAIETFTPNNEQIERIKTMVEV